MLRRPGENVDWLPNLPQNSLPHDGPVPPDRENKHYFSPNRFTVLRQSVPHVVLLKLGQNLQNLNLQPRL